MNKHTRSGPTVPLEKIHSLFGLLQRRGAEIGDGQMQSLKTKFLHHARIKRILKNREDRPKSLLAQMREIPA